MKKNRHSYSAEFKAQRVLEVLAEEKTPLQIASENGIHVKTLSGWVREQGKRMRPIRPVEPYCNISEVYFPVFKEPVII